MTTYTAEQLERLEKMDAEERRAVELYAEEYGDVEDAVKCVEDGEYAYYYDVETPGDVAYLYIRDIYGDDLGPLEYYIDYDKVAADLAIDGAFVQADEKTIIKFY